MLVPLTKGYSAEIDEIDADLADRKWFANFTGSGTVAFAMRWSARRRSLEQEPKALLMHRVILERAIGRALLPCEVCDHKDGNMLNNRRSNLRVATRAQNSQNMRKPRRRKGTSIYKGVSHRRGNRWSAQIRANGCAYHLGSFAAEKDAALAYNEAAARLHGEFAHPNLFE